MPHREEPINQATKCHEWLAATNMARLNPDEPIDDNPIGQALYVIRIARMCLESSKGMSSAYVREMTGEVLEIIRDIASPNEMEVINRALLSNRRQNDLEAQMDMRLEHERMRNITTTANRMLMPLRRL